MKKYFLAALLGSLYAPLLGTFSPIALSLHPLPYLFPSLLAYCFLFFLIFLKSDGVGFALCTAGMCFAYTAIIIPLGEEYLRNGTPTFFPASFGMFVSMFGFWILSRGNGSLPTFVWTTVVVNNAMAYLHLPIHMLWAVTILFLILYSSTVDEREETPDIPERT
ncbi:MAG: hypothetical protein HGB37_02225 [Candidatus Moranbacteria bacterium]|nr:hypothetical protein [Candidatus Moranbacteria bacterium]